MATPSSDKAARQTAEAALSALRGRLRRAFMAEKVTIAEHGDLTRALDDAAADPVGWYNGERSNHEALIEGWERQ